MDAQTRAAWEAGPFARILRDAQADKERHQREAQERSRRLQNAAVWVDEDVSRDPTERGALAHLVESAPNREFGELLMRHYAQSRLRETWRGVDFEHLEQLSAEGLAPRTRQPPLPKPVGDGQDWRRWPRKRSRPVRRALCAEAPRVLPLPGWSAA